MSEDCTELLKEVDVWSFDIFKLHDLARGEPLTILAMKILHDRGLIESLRLDRVSVMENVTLLRALNKNTHFFLSFFIFLFTFPVSF